MCSGVSFALAVLTLCASIGGFLFGYDTGVVSGAVVFIEGDLGISSLQVEVVVSVTVGSAALGSLLSGVPMQRYGRRPVIMLASALFAAGSLVIAAAPGFGALLAGRLVLGFGVGVSSMVVPGGSGAPTNTPRPAPGTRERPTRSGTSGWRKPRGRCSKRRTAAVMASAEKTLALEGRGTVSSIDPERCRWEAEPKFRDVSVLGDT